MRIDSDIIALKKILDAKGASIFKNEGGSAIEYIDDQSKEKELKAYIQTMPGFSSTLNCSENLILQLMRMGDFRKNIIINPIEFYKAFIDIPYFQMEKLFNTINVFKRLDTFARTFDVNVSNSMNRLGEFIHCKDTNRQAIFLALRLLRFLPFSFFNAYIMSGGNLSMQSKSFVLNIRGFLSSLRNTKAHGLNFVHHAYIDSIIKQLENLIDETKQDSIISVLSNPLKTNSQSINVLKRALSNTVENRIDDTVKPIDSSSV